MGPRAWQASRLACAWPTNHWISPAGSRIAAAALLLRSICPNDGDIEILLHEMARTLERIAGVDDACSRTARLGPGQCHAMANARG